jgi:hypothetical protein
LDFALAYATVLANCAVAHTIIGGSEQRAKDAISSSSSANSTAANASATAAAGSTPSSSSHSQKASELLSSALKALEPHKDAATVAPLMGRILVCHIIIDALSMCALLRIRNYDQYTDSWYFYATRSFTLSTQ